MSSCATILTGTKDNISFNSNPQGAKVFIDGIELCTTPCTSAINRSLSDKMAELKLEGYETRIIKLDRKFNAVSIINLTGLLGWAIDAATGSIMQYDRKSYDIELSKDNRTALLNNPAKFEINTSKKIVEVYVVE